jgi:hypothetical protein
MLPMSHLGMLLMSSVLTAGLFVDEPPPAWQPRIEALIRQLGDASFAKREAATKALLAEDEKIVPLLDKAKNEADLEVARRLEQIRKQLITTYLESLPSSDRESLPEVPREMIGIVTARQPKSGDYLLAIIADPKDPLNRPATHLFCATWQSGTGAQLEKYFQSSFRLQAFHRSRYPHGVDAYIETRYWQHHGWLGWPRNLQWRTHTTHLVDGQPHGKPFDYTYPGAAATTGWINAGKLGLGQHKLRFEVEYEFTHQGAKHQGKVRSPEFAFTVVVPAPADDLIAPTNAALAKQVRETLHIVEYEGQREEKNKLFDFGGDRPRHDPWQPQVTWEEPKGKKRGLHIPQWSVDKPLPVDLCFDVTLRDIQSGKSYAGDALVLKKGKTGRGYFTPRDARAFCAGRDGFVQIEVQLQPSRSVALTDPEITSYFGWPITSPTLKAKIINDVAQPRSK